MLVKELQRDVNFIFSTRLFFKSSTFFDLFYAFRSVTRFINSSLKIERLILIIDDTFLLCICIFGLKYMYISSWEQCIFLLQNINWMELIKIPYWSPSLPGNTIWINIDLTWNASNGILMSLNITIEWTGHNNWPHVILKQWMRAFTIKLSIIYALNGWQINWQPVKSR